MNAENRAMKLQRVLETLATGTPEVIGCALVSDDGLIIGSVLPAETDEDSVGGMAAALLALGTRVAVQLSLDELDQVMIKGSGGRALMVQAGDGALLLALMTQKAKLGLVFLDVKHAVSTISNLI